MRSILLFLSLVVVASSAAHAQDKKSGSLTAVLKNTAHDRKGLRTLLDGASEISFFDPDSALVLSEAAVEIAKEIHYKEGEVEALNTYGEAHHFLGDYPQALKFQFEALELSRNMKYLKGEAETLSFIGIVYNELGQYRQALQYLLPAKKIYEELPGEFDGSFVLANIGDSYRFLGIGDSALYYSRSAYDRYINGSSTHLKSFILEHMAYVYEQAGRTDSARKFYNEAIHHAMLSNDKLNMSISKTRIADIFASRQLYDSALIYSHLAFKDAESAGSKPMMMQSATFLAATFNKLKRPDSAFFYLAIAVAMKDSLYGPEKLRKLQLLMLDELSKRELASRQEEKLRNRIKYGILLSGLGIILLIAFFLWRNNRHRKQSNELLLKEKQKVEQAYEELQSTQALLIQSEKMASLGELTAGIAHEIQNPLNFVNNFSEVNKELLAEMNDGINNKNYEEVRTLAHDIAENEEKINFHGKRADAIVKGMLQHSRSNNGQKELTDINSLCDEYLRLSYHGLRAKDKTFNATFKTDLDGMVGKINIVPQDIGRVVLNLLNNAFYSVDERKRITGNVVPGKYEPTVIISTRKSSDRIEIRVKDNGNGIPEKVVDKIFQPFFTTKPTGKGTGLGLSLSYEIVKAHGGELKVETKEGEGTTFIIQLPAN